MQVKEKFSRPRTQDALFKKTSDMLSNLGLGHYEENFKKEFLTDQTLPLLSDRQVAQNNLFSQGFVFMLLYDLIYCSCDVSFSTLKEAKIPVGARVLIIDHIQKFESCSSFKPFNRLKNSWVDLFLFLFFVQGGEGEEKKLEVTQIIGSMHI